MKCIEVEFHSAPTFFLLKTTLGHLFRVLAKCGLNHQGYALCCDLGEPDVNMHVLLLLKIDFTYNSTPKDVIQRNIFS